MIGRIFFDRITLRRFLPRITGSSLVAMAVLASTSAFALEPGHRLAGGPDNPVRERELDIHRIEAKLRIDMRAGELAGDLYMSLSALREGIETITLDAAGLEIESVRLVEGAAEGGMPAQALPYSTAERKLEIGLPAPLTAGMTLGLRIRYRSRPGSGLYFFPGTRSRAGVAWNYGEGGLHYGWLPLYNDTNDRFQVVMDVRVVRPWQVLGNGSLEATTDHEDGTRSFRWVLDQPIPNYLLALNVGEFVRVPLADAHSGGRKIPLAVWTHEGAQNAARYSFERTPAMLEFFAAYFAHPFVWPKYDQVTLRSFSGAMETATMAGFSESSLHSPGDPPDDDVGDLQRPYPIWTTEDTIAHELAHHWFGNLLTCKSLGSLWLNESFATFAHTLWNEQRNGNDDLTYQRWRYLHYYLDGVRDSGVVRPLENARYSAPGDTYNRVTYFKGALVLHMLRHFLSPAEFDRGLHAYLRANRFAEVDSSDFRDALEQASGRNLSWFFADWIHGAGFPRLDVRHQWSAERGTLDLSIRQVHADLPFEDTFELPVDIEIFTAQGAHTQRIYLRERETHLGVALQEEPLALVFDKGNWLIAEIHQTRPLRETLVQLRRGDLAARLRAVRELAERFQRRPGASDALRALLADQAAFWGLRQEAALALGTIGNGTSAAALEAVAADPDRRIRRAAAIGFGRVADAASVSGLRTMIETDAAEEVVATAAYALGGTQAAGTAAFLAAQLGRDSDWADVIRMGSLEGLAALESPPDEAVYRPYLGPEHERATRLAALDGWMATDGALDRRAQLLRGMILDPDPEIRAAALEHLGELRRPRDLEFLAAYAVGEHDPNLAQAAREAIETIEAFAQTGDAGQSPRAAR